MFAYISGKLAYKMEGYVIVDVNGIGYKIFMSQASIDKLGNTGGNVKVHTYLKVREDDMSLFGFNTGEELSMFELLISVSGVGAKTALSMLACIEPSKFALAVITNDIKTLTDISKILADENEEYKLKLKEELGKGLSFPKARENAIIDYLKNNSNADKCTKKLENLTEENIKQVLSKSNNILAIEYLKAMERQHFNVTHIMIRRESDNVKTNLTSATEIRKGLSDKSYVEHNLANYVPKDVYNKIRENIANNTYYQDLEPLSKIIIYKIRMMKTEEIANVPDVSEGLENTIKNAAFETNSINNLISKVKSKRYTETRIQRILTCILLGITKDDKEMSKTIVPYVRILGVKKDAKQLLSKIPNAVISIKEFEDNNANENLKRMLDFDKKSSDIYSIGYNGNHSLANLDYTKKLIVI